MTLTVRDMVDLANELVTGDAFAAYGEQIAPAGRAHPSNRYATAHAADLSPLEQKMREKQRLSRAYRADRSARRRKVLDSEPRLHAFARYLRTVPANGDDLPSVLAESWLPEAPLDVRLMALELTTRRCDQINRSLGNVPLDDPLPPMLGGYDDTRKRCADVLYPGGR